MKKMPCEQRIWDVLPSIRRELTIRLVKKYKINQKQTAELLGVTPAAICQYLSKKRKGIKIVDKEVLKQIDKSADHIYQFGKEVFLNEICKICKLFKSTNNYLKEGSFENNHDPISCEIKLWKYLPAIRKAFTKILKEKYACNNKEISKILGISEASVSRYLTGKRSKIDIKNPLLKKEILKSVKKIIDQQQENLVEEICKICHLMEKTIDKGCLDESEKSI